MEKRTKLLESKEPIQPFITGLTRQAGQDIGPLRIQGKLPISKFLELDNFDADSIPPRTPGTPGSLDFEKKEEASRSLISNFSSFFFSTDNDGIIQLSVGKITISRADSGVAGKLIFDVFAEHLELLTIVKEALKGHPITRVISISDAFYEIECKPKYEDDKLTGLVGMVSNVTEKVNHQQSLVQAKKRAESKALAKDRLIANTSHELRTYLNAIIGYSNLLLDNDLSPEIKTQVEAIQQSGDTLLNMINTILDLSKIDSGKLILERTTFNLNEVVSNIKKTFLPVIEKKNLVFTISVDRTLPTLIGDPMRVSQILINLVGNAVKFTESGEINVAVRLKHRAEECLHVEFRVLDTGIGISKDRQRAIFKPFVQASDTTSREYGGTGLGLSIAKKLVELHGGRIEVISEPGKGSAFTFAISLDISQAAPTSTAKISNGEESFLRGKKVLIVEDDPFNRHIAKAFLTKWGMKVSLAENGRLAVELCRKEKYDIILMDIQMPVLNGIDTAKVINSIGKNSVPIVAISAHTFEREKKGCRDAGISYHLSKPYHPKDLKQVVMDALDYNTAEKSGFIKETDPQVWGLKALHSATNSDTGLIRDLANIYLTTSIPIIKDMRDCGERYDVKGLRALMHRFLNSVKTMGIAPLSVLIEEFLDDKYSVYDREKLMTWVAQVENLVIKSHHELKGQLIEMDNQNASAF